MDMLLTGQLLSMPDEQLFSGEQRLETHPGVDAFSSVVIVEPQLHYISLQFEIHKIS